ncbi:NifU family protein [Nocardioides salsibiostraticola]
MTQLSERPIIDLDVLAGDLDEAMVSVAALEPEARQSVTAAVDALNALHKAALTTVVRRLKDDPAGKPILFDLVDEPDVRMILSLHGLIRPDLGTQVQQVLTGVRIALQSHGGDVEFDSVRDGIVYVRLEGACNGCSMASVTMRDGVEKALVEGVPGITGVEVLPNEPTPTLIPLSEIGFGPPGVSVHGAGDSEEDLVGAGWCPAFAVDEIELGQLRAITLKPEGRPTVEAIVVNASGQLTSYLNSCAHQGLPLDDAEVDSATGSITCPWHGFCYDAGTGECTSMPGAQLEQLPLRMEEGRIWIRPGG